MWELAEPLINNSHEAYLILDDSVQDKSYSKKIEMVKLQYSGNAHGLVKGIGIVNLIHAHRSDYYPLDFRVYAPDLAKNKAIFIYNRSNGPTNKSNTVLRLN